MNIRKQMARAIRAIDIEHTEPGYCTEALNGEHDLTSWEVGVIADAALSIFANPSDELVERCAAGITDEAIGCCCISKTEAAYLTRLVLAAAVGEG